MERYEMTELLSKKAGVSLEQARAALEENDWDLLDAMIALDRARRTSSATHAQSGGADDGPVQPVKTVSGGKEPGGMAAVWRYMKKLLSAGMDNYFIVSRRGRDILTLPVLVLAVLMLVSFGLILLALAVGPFCECRYRFEGRHLGREGINRAMGKVSDAAGDIKASFRAGRDRNG